MTILFELFGWIGTSLIVYAYYLNSSKKIKPTSKKYLYYNLIGSFLLGLNVLERGAYPALFLQVVWFIITYKAYKGK